MKNQNNDNDDYLDEMAVVEEQWLRENAFDDYTGPDKPMKQKLQELPVRIRMHWQRFFWRIINAFRVRK